MIDTTKFLLLVSGIFNLVIALIFIFWMFDPRKRREFKKAGMLFIIIAGIIFTTIIGVSAVLMGLGLFDPLIEILESL